FRSCNALDRPVIILGQFFAPLEHAIFVTIPVKYDPDAVFRLAFDDLLSRLQRLIKYYLFRLWPVNAHGFGPQPELCPVVPFLSKYTDGQFVPFHIRADKYRMLHVVHEPEVYGTFRYSSIPAGADV